MVTGTCTHRGGRDSCKVWSEAMHRIFTKRKQLSNVRYHPCHQCSPKTGRRFVSWGAQGRIFLLCIHMGCPQKDQALRYKALHIWGRRCRNVHSVYTSASPAPPVLDSCLSFMFSSHSDSQWGCAGFGTLQEHLWVLEWAQKGNQQVLGQPLGRAARTQPQTHNYCTIIVYVYVHLYIVYACCGLCDQPVHPHEGTAQSHMKGRIFKWNSAEFTAAELCTSLYVLLNIIINIWRKKKKKGSKWGVAIATATSKEFERYGTTLTEGMFYLLFPILNVQQSCAAGHCCAGWWPSLGSTCLLLVGSALREAPHFQCWQAGPKANSPISTATSAPNSCACWWSAPPLLNYNMLPIYKAAK